MASYIEVRTDEDRDLQVHHSTTSVKNRLQSLEGVDQKTNNVEKLKA